MALVAPHYYVGSFDDDGSYILAAKALLAGQGLTGHLASGGVVVGLYPPGFSALIAPLVWLWPHNYLPLRLFSVACFAAVFPLTWLYLGRRGLGPGTRVAALTVLALGPPFATFASMVMAETAYLVLLLVFLILVDRWEGQARVWTATGIGVVLAGGGIIWLKQAGVAFVAGVVLWLVLRRRRWGPGWAGLGRAFALGAGTAALLAPVAIARLATGIPLLGARYSGELGGYYQGGLIRRLVKVLPGSAWHLVSTAIPATIVPYLEPLPIRGHWPDLWKALSWQVTILMAVGAVVWVRRHRDATVVAVPLYLFECVLWPFVNERRAILVLPVFVGLYALGAVTTWRFLRGRLVEGRQVGWAQAAAAVVVTAVVAGPLVAQMPRDYLYGWNQSSSQFGGSRYVAILSRLGQPSDVVENDYLSSTALFTGHQTNWTAFQMSLGGICYLPAVTRALAADDAAFLFLGDINKPGVLDSPCLLNFARTQPWAVELLHTARDNATVFELVGPGTGHPDLVDDTSSIAPAAGATATTASLEWDWSAPRLVTQASVGAAAMSSGPTASVAIQLRTVSGTWVTVAHADAAAGDERGDAPYLLTSLASGMTATAMRVVATGGEPGAGVTVRDAHALGPASSR